MPPSDSKSPYPESDSDESQQELQRDQRRQERQEPNPHGRCPTCASRRILDRSTGQWECLNAGSSASEACHLDGRYLARVHRPVELFKQEVVPPLPPKVLRWNSDPDFSSNTSYAGGSSASSDWSMYSDLSEGPRAPRTPTPPPSPFPVASPMLDLVSRASSNSPAPPMDNWAYRGFDGNREADQWQEHPDARNGRGLQAYRREMRPDTPEDYQNYMQAPTSFGQLAAAHAPRQDYQNARQDHQAQNPWARLAAAHAPGQDYQTPRQDPQAQNPWARLAAAHAPGQNYQAPRQDYQNARQDPQAQNPWGRLAAAQATGQVYHTPRENYQNARIQDPQWQNPGWPAAHAYQQDSHESPPDSPEMRRG